MTFEQYAAQNAQQDHEERPAQNAEQVDLIAAKLEAEKLSSLTDQLRTAIETRADPAATLQAITNDIFGAQSEQATALAGKIADDHRPGGRELVISDIRQQRRLLVSQSKRLEARQQAIAEELGRLEERESALVNEATEAGSREYALIDVLTFCKGISDPQPNVIERIETLYNRHSSDPAAMGLLYGCIIDLIRKQYGAGRLDLVQQESFIRIKKQIAAALE